MSVLGSRLLLGNSIDQEAPICQTLLLEWVNPVIGRLDPRLDAGVLRKQIDEVGAIEATPTRRRRPNIYTHLFTSDVERAADALGAFYEAALTAFNENVVPIAAR